MRLSRTIILWSTRFETSAFLFFFPRVKETKNLAFFAIYHKIIHMLHRQGFLAFVPPLFESFVLFRCFLVLFVMVLAQVSAPLGANVQSCLCHFRGWKGTNGVFAASCNATLYTFCDLPHRTCLSNDVDSQSCLMLNSFSHFALVISKACLMKCGL